MRFGLIGDGRIAKRHKKAIAQIGGVINWIYDPRYKGINITSDGHVVIHTLTKKDFALVDYVIICSPTHLHYDYLKTVLQYNIKVIVEKPMVLPWQPIIDNDAISVVLQLRWLSLPAKADKVFIKAARNEAYFVGWKGNPEMTGGLFFDLFIHYIDLARNLGAEFEGIVLSEGTQERYVDKINLMNVDMDIAYEKMYKDIVFYNRGVKPADVAKLHWLLGKFTERFGSGKEILGQRIVIKPADFNLI
jgi:UDP-N-acetyl-2-amino-2-deoxyglucuronate dehydrogenase